MMILFINKSTYRKEGPNGYAHSSLSVEGARSGALRVAAAEPAGMGDRGAEEAGVRCWCSWRVGAHVGARGGPSAPRTPRCCVCLLMAPAETDQEVTKR